MMQTQLVKKTAIIESGDFNLSAARYLEKVEINSDYEIVKLKDVVDYEQPNKYIVESTNYDDSFTTPVLTAGKTFILGKTNEIDGIFSIEKLPVIIFDDFTTASKYVDFQFKVKSSAMKILHVDRSKSIPLFIYHLMQNLKFDVKEHKRFWISQYSDLEIPLPPLEIQEQIVKEIEGYQQIIDGCRQVVDNYKPVIDIDSSWEKVKLKEISEVIMGQSPKSVYYNDNNQGLPFYQGKTHFGDRYLKKHSTYTSKITKESNQGDIVMSVRAPVGSVNLTPFEICIGRGLCAIRPKNIVDLTYIYYYLQQDDVIKGDMGATYESINREKINETEISYPKNRFELAEKLEQERKVIDGNKELIKIYENKIKARINKVWSYN